MKPSFLGAFQALAWAEQQVYGNPLEKLIMLRICSASAPEADEYNNSFLSIEYADLSAYCFASERQCSDAVKELERRGLLIIGAGGAASVSVSLSWWQRNHTFTTPSECGDYGQDFWPLVLECQDGRCWYCGQPFGDQTPHKEHQIPRAHGGQNIIENLVLACAPCNLSKNARTVTEFRAFKARETRQKDFRFWGESR